MLRLKEHFHFGLNRGNCMCGRRKAYEDCCMPLHYLPLSQFIIHNKRNVSSASSQYATSLSSSKIVRKFATWPGHIVYLHGIETDRALNQIVDKTLYKARFMLQRPGFWPYSDRTVDTREDCGDSHFRVKDIKGQFGNGNTLKLTLNGDDASMVGYTNSEGFLKFIEYGPFKAETVSYAENLATTRVTSALSLLSLRFDSPLYVRQIQLENLATRELTFLHTNSNWQVVVPEQIAVNPPELLMLCASFYRQALLSSSPLYAFLCYYKVITTVHHARRTLVAVNRKMPDERLPPTKEEAIPWLGTSFFVEGLTINEDFTHDLLPEGVQWGMSFAHIIDKIFRPKRHEIAHAFDEDIASNTLDPDHPGLSYKVQLMLPLTKVIARHMTRNTYPHILSPVSK